MPQQLFAVAPMMGRTDRHARRFLRLFSKDVILYTEMIHAQAILLAGKKRERMLGFSEAEQPVVLQLGGNNPEDLAKAAAIGAEFGYREINLNVGCPSQRVQNGGFGVRLMREPVRVQECVAAIFERTRLPVSIKCRIGVDDDSDYGFLERFVDTTQKACSHFIVHARIALLKGLNPKENRSVPPLRYSEVYRLKQAFPKLRITINGGICNTREVEHHLTRVDGVMIGRKAWCDPYLLARLQQGLYAPESTLPDRVRLLEEYLPYVADQLHRGIRLSSISRPLFGLFSRCAGGRQFRRHVSTWTQSPNAGIEVIQQAAERMRTAIQKEAEQSCSV